MNQLASAIPNTKQSEEWNNATGRRWLEQHEAVDRQIAARGLRVIECADIRPGEHVLDVGCGCGEATLELPSRVGASGSVTGIDISRLLIDTERQDGSRADPLITAYLQSFGRYGVPLDVIYRLEAPQGIQLPELLTPGVVMDGFARATAGSKEEARE
jgi:SAM-dependent methyltransferase